MTDKQLAPITLNEEQLKLAVEAICDRARELDQASLGMPLVVWQSMKDASAELLAIAGSMEKQARSQD